MRSDKMRWVLSIVSWSAMQVRSRQLAADHRREGARLRWPQIGGRVTVLAEASGWYLSQVAKERIPARRDAAVCVKELVYCIYVHVSREKVGHSIIFLKPLIQAKKNADGVKLAAAQLRSI